VINFLTCRVSSTRLLIKKSVYEVRKQEPKSLREALNKAIRIEMWSKNPTGKRRA